MKKRLLFILCLSLLTITSAAAQTKTVTNADLEKFRQKRVQAETEYRKNYEKLGFPSPEEQAREREQSRFEAEETIARRREQRMENEGDFSAQAAGLRREIAAVEAQISYVASLFPVNQSPTSYYTGGVAPFGYSRYGRANSIWRGDNTGRVFFGGSFRSRAGFGNARPSAPQIQNFYRANNLNNRRGGIYGRNTRPIRNGAGISIGIGGGFGNINNGQFYGYAPTYGYYIPVVVDRYDYTQDEAVTELRRLEQQRAGLYAKWRLLQDEAKKAGVKID